jgi:uncharacterized peroxidase-related enzyme
MSRVKLVTKDQTEGKTLALYEEIERNRGGKVPNLFMALGYNAGIMSPAIDAALFIGAESRIPPREKQLAYLATSRLNGCEYCLERHALAAMKAGMTQAQVEALHREGELSEQPEFDNREKLIIRFSEEMTRISTVTPTMFENLREFFDDEEIVELTFVVASANMFNRLASALGIELEPEIKNKA